MIYFKTEKDGYIASVGTAEASVGIEISKAEYDEILAIKQNKPVAEIGYDYKLKTDLTWELVELSAVAAPIFYSEFELQSMTNAQLQSILADMGISGSMTKANMVALILSKQAESI